jgi:hypothetical protein
MCANLLTNLQKYIKASYNAGKYDFKVTEPEKAKIYTFPKMQLTMMYHAINKFEASDFVILQFTLNFGISQEVRAQFNEYIQN